MVPTTNEKTAADNITPMTAKTVTGAIRLIVRIKAAKTKDMM
ncbi:hypothetical protein [Virgibacillus sp. 7505]|nr:hypothetical protein [Virgibacillus sp. 7505]